MDSSPDGRRCRLTQSVAVIAAVETRSRAMIPQLTRQSSVPVAISGRAFRNGVHRRVVRDQPDSQSLRLRPEVGWAIREARQPTRKCEVCLPDARHLQSIALKTPRETRKKTPSTMRKLTREKIIYLICFAARRRPVTPQRCPSRNRRYEGARHRRFRHTRKRQKSRRLRTASFSSAIQPR